MRVNIRFMQRLITLIVSLGTISISILLLSACGANTDSTPPEEVPPLTKAVTIPYVLGNALWEFNPEENSSEQLLESSQSLLLLDIDQSGSQNDEETATVLPEYAVYVIDQALWVYDLHTRQHAELFNFAATDDAALGQTICDLQKVITVDVEQLKDKIESFKEEPAVYVKTSEDAACDANIAAFSYTKIIIADSFTETITIGEEETTENEEGEEVTKIVPKQVPVLVGKRRDSQEALMYAGKPIVDLDTKEFGYLGLDRTAGTYKFFITDPETLNKSELWFITREEFKIQPEPGVESSSKDKLFPAVNRPSPYKFLPKALIVEHNWKIVKLNYEDLFDDDKNREREFSLNNPIFERTPETVYSTADTRYYSASKMLAIKDQNHVYTVDTGSADNTLTLIRTMNDLGLLSFQFDLVQDHLVAIKQYADGSAITAIDLSNGQEQTLRGLSPGTLESIQFLDGSLFVSAGDSSSWQTQIFTKTLVTKFTTPFPDTLWTSVYDGRSSIETKQPYLFYPAVIVEDDTDTTDGPTLFNPLVFRYAPKVIEDGKVGEGEYFGQIPAPVGSINNGIYIFSDTYGYAKIKQSAATDAAIETYYFNPSQPSEMQLMYEEASDL